MKFTRRSIVAGGLASPFATALANLVQAQTSQSSQSWPSGIIKIIVPFPPGGSVDPIARMAQPGIQKSLNATLVIENRPGSSGALGTEIPPEIIAQLQSAVQKGLGNGSPAAEKLVALGSEVATPEQMTAKGFADFIRKDYEEMREAAKLAGIQPT